MTFKEFVGALERILGQEAQGGGESPGRAFKLDGGLAFSCMPQGRDQVLFYGVAAPKPANREEIRDLCERFLRKNLSRSRSWPEVLCMNPQSGEIELFAKESLDRSEDDLIEAAGRFANHLEDFMTKDPEYNPGPGPFGMLFP